MKLAILNLKECQKKNKISYKNNKFKKISLKKINKLCYTMKINLKLLVQIKFSKTKSNKKNLILK